MSPNLDPVAELESIKTHVDHSGSPSFSTLSHRHQSDEGSKRSPNGSPGMENELHGEHSHHKKSLLSKIKDKAKKLQHSLSVKKKHDEEGDATMSPFGRSEDNGVRETGGLASLSPRDKSKDHKVREEREEEEEDPEYLGAPMYESKKAPEELKNTAMKHPRENPVITETNLLSVLPAKHEAEQQQKDCIGSNRQNHVISEKNVLSDVKLEKPADSDTTTVTKSIDENTGKKNTNQESNSPSKTVTETVTEKLAPAYAKVSEATHAITQKIQDMAFPESTEPEEDINDVSEINTSGTNHPVGFNTKVWDKGISMKEYISQKFEPNEDDKALSQVISKAISPRKASSEKASFSEATSMIPTPNSVDNKAPLLANTNEIVKEENHGKMLQPN